MRKSKENGGKNRFNIGFINKPYSLLKKTALTTVIGLGLTFNVIYADSNSLSTIYHVYVDGEHVGTVDDKQVVDNYIDKRIDSKQSTLEEEYDLTIGEDLFYVPEKVFGGNTENTLVKEKLDDELSVQVQAYELKVGDRVVGYFKDQESAESTIYDLKAKYVDTEILENIEKTESDKNQDPNLSVGDSKIVDVKLSEEVSLSEAKVLPKEILNPEEGVKVLEKGTLEDKIHTVEEGDTLFSIADQYNLSLDDLFELNSNLSEETLLQIDQEINVTDYEAYAEVLIKEERLVEETIGFEKEVVYSDDLYKGDTKVKQQGQDGKRKVHYAIEKVNSKEVSREVIEKENVKEPVKQITTVGTKVVPSRGTAQFKWPAVGGRISSHVGKRWGSYHKGIYIAGVSNRTIMAADNGVVESAGWHGGYGNKVVINHQNGYKTIYAHLSSISVNAGQTVPKGSKIGVMGSTGNSTGVHLHFEVYKDGSLINPADLF